MSKNRYFKQKLPYSPDLGVHHMNYCGNNYKRGYERLLRNTGAFILSVADAPPPQHTLIHRSMGETPKPLNQGETYDMILLAKGGLQNVLDNLDTRTTEHYRQQLYIASMPFDEAVDRLTKKMYVTKMELNRA